MLPTQEDFVAMALQIGNYFREIGPFIIFGAAAAAAQITIFGRKSGPWTGTRLIAPIAAIPLGITLIAAAALRSLLIFRTGSVPANDPVARETGVLRRAFSYVEDLVFPFMISAGIGAVIVVLTPTEPLWTLLSSDGPWRLVIAPLVAGIVKPRGGTELPLVMALITKGLDPAGAIAAVAGAGYRHARSLPLAAAHVGVGAALGAIFWVLGLA
jgi:uncharacterized membrane protein YraQ (UPF0718 family)